MRILQSHASHISSVSVSSTTLKKSFLKLNLASGEESGGYTVTQTRRIITNSGGQVSYTTEEEILCISYQLLYRPDSSKILRPNESS